jgi:hypothetical protein
MAKPSITTIRLNGIEIFLVGLLRNVDQTLVAFGSLNDLLASYPDSTVPSNIVDLDVALAWCSKPQPKPIESVLQSDQFWEAIEFLDMLEEGGLLDNAALQAHRLALDVASKFLFARGCTIMTAADVTVEESTKLQAMFESCIAALRRALPRHLAQEF